MNHSMPSDKARKVEAEQIRIVFLANAKNQLGGLAGALLLLLAVSFSYESGKFELRWAAWAWFAAMSSTLVLALVVERRWSVPMSDEQMVRWARFKIPKAAVSGCLFGSTSWILLPAQPLQEAALHLLIAVSIASSQAAMVAYRPIHRTHLYALAFVYLTGVIRFFDVFHLFVALALLACVAILVMAANDSESSVRKAIFLALENEELLASRTEEHSRALEAQGKAEVAQRDAELADRAKTTFIAAASHDLRQPLHALVQYVSHLRRLELPSEARETSERIAESTEAVTDLLNAILDFSKITMGAMKPIISNVRMTSLCARLEGQMRPLAMARGLDLRIECEDCWVRTDATLLERLLRNVLHNAVRYTDSGTIVLRARRRADVVRVLISDSGIGIASPDKQRIFDAYVQLNNEGRDRSKGLGLGLAIVRDLAVLLGVRIRVKSVPECGTTFRIEVPLGAVEETRSGTTSDSKHLQYVRGAFAMLIDDDALVREAMTVTLRDLGCRVCAAADEQEAAELLRTSEFPPQILICDYRLGAGKTGIQAIASLRRLKEELYGTEHALPAVIISGDTAEEELKQVANAGLRMLHKPVEAQQLLSAMATELSSASSSPVEQGTSAHGG